MKTVVLGPPPVELEALIAHRRAIGADRYDEIWEGEYHMAPAPNAAHGDLDAQLTRLLYPFVQRAGMYVTGSVNIGVVDDFRVPDQAIHRQRPRGVWLSTVAIAVEIVSPDDETWDKLPFYAARDVDELLTIDPRERSVVWLGLNAGAYAPIERTMLGFTVDELAAQIDWPPLDD